MGELPFIQREIIHSSPFNYYRLKVATELTYVIDEFQLKRITIDLHKSYENKALYQLAGQLQNMADQIYDYLNTSPHER